MSRNQYIVGYTYDLRSTHWSSAPKTKHRCFATQHEAERYAEVVKAHALTNPEVVFVSLYINAPLPEHVYVAPGGYMPGPTICEMHIRDGKVS